MKKKYIIFLFIAFNFSSQLYLGDGSSLCAQNAQIDSLQLLINKDNADTNKLIHTNALCWEYIKIGLLDTALNCGNYSLQLAKELLKKSTKPEEHVGIKKNSAASYNNIGAVYYYQGNYSKTLEYWLAALKLDEEVQNKKGIAKRLGNIGLIYYQLVDYPRALDYYLKALDMSRVLRNKQLEANVLGNIGLVYNDQASYTKALAYFFIALKISKEIEDKPLESTVLGNIGMVYGNQAAATQDLSEKKILLNKTLECFIKSLELAKIIDNKGIMANMMGNVGVYYTKNGNFKEAEQYLKSANAIGESIGAISYLKDSEAALAKLYDTTAKIAINKGYWEKAAKDYERSVLHYKKAVALKDTIYNQDNKKQLVQKEMNYQFEKKEETAKAKQSIKDAVILAEKNKQKFILIMVSSLFILAFLFAGFIWRSLRLTRKQKSIIEIKNKQTELQKKIIEERNKNITDSIHYAKRIQNALLREEEHVNMHLPEHFVLFIPKDIVSGDFYWANEKQDFWYFAVGDCTGHGVPGAIMSMLGISFLNDIVSMEGFHSPAEILDRMRAKVVKELRQTGEDGGSKDGMDISLVRLNLKTKELQWAGANNALHIILNGELKKIKADKQPIGYHLECHPFTNHEIQLRQGDSIYIFSDGYADQFGGPLEKKLTYKKLENLLIIHNHNLMKDQKGIFKKRFFEWKGLLEQIDDVCVIGVRV